MAPDSSQPKESNNPFLSASGKHPLVALRGQRNGYIMLAPAQEITNYAQLPPTIWAAAQDWAATLETAGSPRTYTIILSEVTRHLHIHLFPRWPEDTLSGTALFDTREQSEQAEKSPWTPEINDALTQWAQRHKVELA